jgi:hypothetical protein
MSPSDCRDIADKVAAGIGKAREQQKVQVEALTKAETYFKERRNPAPDYLLRRQYREEAEAAIVAALSAYEGKGEK